MCVCDYAHWGSSLSGCVCAIPARVRFHAERSAGVAAGARTRSKAGVRQDIRVPKKVLVRTWARMRAEAWSSGFAHLHTLERQREQPRGHLPSVLLGRMPERARETTTPWLLRNLWPT